MALTDIDGQRLGDSVGDKLGIRNLIINGAMNVAQRGTSGTANGFTCIDRFGRDVNGGTGTFTDSQQTLTSGSPYDEGFRKFYRTASSSASSAGSTSYLQVRYKAEAQDIANSGWDYTDSSSFVTLSFWVRASVAQTYGFGVQTHDGTSYAYNKNFALSANTWTKIEQRIPGNSNLQFDNDQNIGLTIKFWPHLGSTYNGATDDTWNTQASNNLGSSIGTGWWTASSASFDLTGVQLEVGNTATPFEKRTFADELTRCQRYFQKSYNQEHAPGSATSTGTAWVTIAQGGGRITHTAYLSTPMRATPTLTLYDWAGASGKIRTQAGNGQTASASYVSEHSVTVDANDVSITECIFQYTCEAEL